MAMKPRTGEAPAQAPLDQPLFVDDAPTEPILRAPNPLQESVRFVNTDLEKAVQERALKNMGEDGSLNIPDHVPRSLVENPNAGGAREVVPGADKKTSWVKRGIAATVAVGAVGAAAYGIGYLKTKGEVDAFNDARGGDVTTSAPAAPGYEGVPNTTEQAPLDMFNTDITHEGYGRQLEVTIPYLQERRAQSMQEASDELDLQNRVNTLKESELPSDPAKRQAQIDQNNITADLWTISKETNTVLARNLLGAVYWDNPDTNDDAFDNGARLIGNGEGKILAPATVMDVSPIYTTGSVGGVAVDGQPTYLVQVVERTKEGAMYDMVISQRYSQNGEVSNPVVVKVIHDGQPNWVDEPSQMPQQR